MTAKTKISWTTEFLELTKTDKQEVIRQLTRKIEHFGGKAPPNHGRAIAEYGYELYKYMKETKRKYDAHMDEMLTFHEDDGGYTIQSETSLDPLDLWPEPDRGAIALSNGDGVSYFTPLEIRRIILILRDMAEQLESATKEAAES